MVKRRMKMMRIKMMRMKMMRMMMMRIRDKGLDTRELRSFLSFDLDLGLDKRIGIFQVSITISIKGLAF